MKKTFLPVAIFLVFLNAIFSFAENGHLFLNSNIENLKIFIDETKYEEFPLFLEFQKGTYSINVCDDHYQGPIVGFDIRPDEVTKIYLLDKQLDFEVPKEDFKIIQLNIRLNVPLNKEEGSLAIFLEPFGTTVILDGNNEGTTPLSISKISAGRHLLVLEKEGETTEIEVEIDPGTKLVVRGDMNDVKFESENEKGEKDSLEKSEILFAGVGGVSNPERIFNVPPEYPKRAKKSFKEGYVILQVVIGLNGKVENIAILKDPWPGYGFEEATIAAVKQWRYEPAKLCGEPVSTYFTIIVKYFLDE